jgi:hypothetical protein
VLLPGVGWFGEFDPGTVVGVVGIDVPPGGVAVPPEGVVVPPGTARPADPAAPPGAAPPAGALCATSQTAQNRNVEGKASFVADFVADIEKASCAMFSRDSSNAEIIKETVWRESSAEHIRRMPYEEVNNLVAMVGAAFYWPVSVKMAGLAIPAARALI